MDGVLPKQKMIVQHGPFKRSIAELHTLVRVAPKETTAPKAHESIRGGVYLDPSRPQYRHKQGAVKCTQYPVDPTIPSPIDEVGFGSQYQVIRQGLCTTPPAPNYHMSHHRYCLWMATTARTINNILWDVVTESGGLQALRAMTEVGQDEIIHELQMRWRVELQRLRDQLDDIYYLWDPAQQTWRNRTGTERLRMLQDLAGRAMGDGYNEALKALEKVLNCTP